MRAGRTACGRQNDLNMIHVDECPVGDTNLRLTPTGKQGKNQFSAGVRRAYNYEI